MGWKYVSHPNVLPFLGVSESLLLSPSSHPPFCIISPWQPNGNIIEYIQKHQGVNRLQLVSDRNNHQTSNLRPVFDSLRKLPMVSNVCIRWVSYTVI